jgi:hypothetical protein
LGFVGNGNGGTSFVAAPNATGIVFAARAVAQNQFSGFEINRNGALAITIDTSWVNFPQDSQGNYYHRVFADGVSQRITFTGTVTNGSKVITGLSVNPVSLGFARGFALIAPLANVQCGSYVDTFTSTTITMIVPAIANGTVTFTATPPQWFCQNNNDTTFDNCRAGGGNGDKMDVGFLHDSSGGSVWMYGCEWFGAVSYISAQNFLMSGCEGFGLAYVAASGGYNSGVLQECQIFDNAIYNCALMIGANGSQALKIVGGMIGCGATGHAIFGSCANSQLNLVSAEEVVWTGSPGCTMLSTASGTAVVGISVSPISIQHSKCSFYEMTLNDAAYVVNQLNNSESSYNGGIPGQTITSTPSTITQRFVISAVYHVHGFNVSGGAQYSCILNATNSPATVNKVNEIAISGITISYTVSGGVISASTSTGSVSIQVDRISGI